MRRFAAWVTLWVGVGVGAIEAQQRPAITGIAFVRVYAADPFESDAFYRMLGFAPEPATETLRRYDLAGSQWLEVMPLPDPAPRARLAAVGFTTRDAAGLETYLKARGVKIDEPLADDEFAVLDPEGNRVVFVQAGTHLAPAKRAGGAGELTAKRLIHAGFMVKSAEAEDHFWKETLGFREYWHGGMTEGKTDFASLQVPDGSDWVEYMLNRTLPSDAKQVQRDLGGMDHFSLGVEHMADAQAALDRNGCGASPQADNCKHSQMGRDGKVQMNLYDPDETRVEYMEFKPSGPVCCSEFKGKHPTDVEDK